MPSANDVSLIVPGLQQALQSCLADPQLSNSFTAIRKILRFSSRTAGPRSLTEIIKLLTGWPSRTDLPVAAFAADATGIGQTESVFWLVARPVVMQADRDHLLLSKASAQSFTNELQTLATLLEQHFSDIIDNIITQQDYLLIGLAGSQDIQTYSYLDAIGKNLHNYLPSGADGSSLNALMNEIQMLIYPQQFSFNALWLEFSGCAQKPPELKPQIFTTDPLFANALGWTCIDNLHDVLVLLDDHQQTRAMLIDTLLDTDADVLTDLTAIDTICAFFLHQLRQGKINSLSLQEGDGRSHLLKRFDTWRFWRKPC